MTAADVAEVQSADASGGLNFDSLQASQFPMNGRQVYMLMDLTPGVQFTQEAFGATGYSGTRAWDTSGAYVMNGGVQGTNSFSLNGAPISPSPGTWQLAFPTVDAVQEFKVMTNTYDAAIGRTGGGSVNTKSLKSGSNATQWHGTLFGLSCATPCSTPTSRRIIRWARRSASTSPTISAARSARRSIREGQGFRLCFSYGEGLPRSAVPFPVKSPDVPPLDLRDGQHFTRGTT